MLDIDGDTEGAIPTGLEIIPISSLATTVRFNRPFLIAAVLKDTQKHHLLGRVTNPSQA